MREVEREFRSAVYEMRDTYLDADVVLLTSRMKLDQTFISATRKQKFHHLLQRTLLD